MFVCAQFLKYNHPCLLLWGIRYPLSLEYHHAELQMIGKCPFLPFTPEILVFFFQVLARHKLSIPHYRESGNGFIIVGKYIKQRKGLPACTSNSQKHSFIVHDKKHANRFLLNAVWPRMKQLLIIPKGKYYCTFSRCSGCST